MQPHELASLFPMMSHAEFEGLKADIRKNGLLEPIVAYEGSILDGRNRYKACVELGVEPTIVEFTGNDPQSWVIAKNFFRRRLSKTQTILTMIKTAEHIAKNARARKVAGVKSSKKKERTIDSVVEMFSHVVSATTLARYQEVQRLAHPEVWQKLTDEKLPLGTAMKIVRLPKEEQIEALLQDPKTIKRAPIESKHVEDDQPSDLSSLTERFISLGSQDPINARRQLAKIQKVYIDEEEEAEAEEIDEVVEEPSSIFALTDRFIALAKDISATEVQGCIDKMYESCGILSAREELDRYTGNDDNNLATIVDKLNILLAATPKEEASGILLRLLQSGEDYGKLTIGIVEQIRIVGQNITSQENRKLFVEALGALVREFRDVSTGRVPQVESEKLLKLRKDFYKNYNVDFPETDNSVSSRFDSIEAAMSARKISEEIDLDAVISSVT